MLSLDKCPVTTGPIRVRGDRLEHPVSTLEVGKYYLTNTGRVWRIMQCMLDGRVLDEHRSQHFHGKEQELRPGMLTGTLPAEVAIESEVPCDWTAEGDG